MAKNKLHRYMVRITETYESFAVVEAETPTDAEYLCEDLVNNGEIDGVSMTGTLNGGGYDRRFDCMGTTKKKVTARKDPDEEEE